jgi:hypothetical protein
MIFTKYPCLFFEMKFDSLMGRSLLIAEPIGGINGKPVVVATAHFESLDSQLHRKDQMEATFELLS